jgi:hypothetical protein
MKSMIKSVLTPMQVATQRSTRIPNAIVVNNGGAEGETTNRQAIEHPPKQAGIHLNLKMI